MTPGTIVIFSDIGCPWATLAIHGLHQARSRLGLEDEVVLDLRSFPLELMNEQATPKPIIDAEVPVVGALAPEFGWQVWRGAAHDYPVTMLPAMEAVHAAKEQHPRAAEALDLRLRRAFFVEGRNLSLHHEIVAAARDTKDLDDVALEEALVSGRARRRVFEDGSEAKRIEVEGSPHLYLPDGTDVHNPGVEKHWEGEPGEGFPVVDSYEPATVDELLVRSAKGDGDG